MLVVGAKGFAKEILEVLHKKNKLSNLVFFDDINNDIGTHLFEKFKIIKTKEAAKQYFETVDKSFTIGIGNPKLREKLYFEFKKLGGKFVSTISKDASIGSYCNTIGNGSNIMSKVVITNDVTIGKGVIINQITSIGHDVSIGDFCEICPNVSISGNCNLGSRVFVGTGAILLPNITVGNNTIIGAGAVVNFNLPDNCVAIGIPAKIIKQL